jgi:hypothetical protein
MERKSRSWNAKPICLEIKRGKRES